MPDQETGPPEMEMPAPPQETGTHHSHHADEADSTPQGDTKPGKSISRASSSRTPAQQEALEQLERRREAAHRSMPLDCGCRDTWTCTCDLTEQSTRWVDAGGAAAEYILAAGYTPLLDANTLRALWRRRGSDRRLAQRLHQLTEGARSA